MERLLSVREAREILGISTGMFYKLVGRGELPVVKLGERALFRPSDVDELVERNVRRRRSEEATPPSGPSREETVRGHDQPSS